MKKLILVSLAGLIGGCASDGSMDAAGAPPVSAVLRDASGQERASAKVRQEEGGLRIWVVATAMSAGTYGTHVHTSGRCDPPDFASAGAHWNPSSRQHGSQNPQGPHMGDLPNLTVGNDGKGSIEFGIPGGSLRSGTTPLLDTDGASIVIHAAADDYKTDPSGNSGARVACGVLG